ncbi:DUF2845 domain-containing protein [Chitiniphilus purpureus]|uniref:DUF2845 domain-containing protein n=1 Tax=Chitiniphilus purpureus TaxID=2981137 RepID=A0ABY6DVJ0_9NEIS|nr:DUF2845 domain-containing protein [Chitiniphilus sp. CD1]UXY17076.1 DUF2845 domain-containing protein [Chitiniphilus sp. CD1]
MRPALSTLCLLLAAAPLHADSTLRCGNLLVQPGDSASHVIGRCGAPQTRATSVEPVFATNRHGRTHQVGSIEVQRWTYDRGPNQFNARLRFEDGTLQRIDFDY